MIDTVAVVGALFLADWWIRRHESREKGGTYARTDRFGRALDSRLDRPTRRGRSTGHRQALTVPVRGGRGSRPVPPTTTHLSTVDAARAMLAATPRRRP